MSDLYWLDGKWLVEVREDVDPSDPAHLKVLLPYNGFWNPVIPISTYPGDRLSVERSKEIAELIAAAPTLLTSLVWAIGQLEMLGFVPEEADVKAHMDVARDLIATHWSPIVREAQRQKDALKASPPRANFADNRRSDTKRPDISIAEFKRDAGSVTVSMKEAILEYIEYLEQRANTLPDSIQEALNSGDGVYRP